MVVWKRFHPWYPTRLNFAELHTIHAHVRQRREGQRRSLRALPNLTKEFPVLAFLRQDSACLLCCEFHSEEIKLPRTNGGREKSYIMQSLSPSAYNIQLMGQASQHSKWQCVMNSPTTLLTSIGMLFATKQELITPSGASFRKSYELKVKYFSEVIHSANILRRPFN
jgi:hypothetical protein